jgi:hypothetical protein
VSVQAVAYVLEGHPAKGADRLVLISLANHADGAEFECWPSVDLIAWETNLSADHVRRALRSMVKEGWITRSVNAAPDERIPGDRRPNLYRIAKAIRPRVRVDVLPVRRGSKASSNAERVGQSRSPRTRRSPTKPSVEPSEKTPAAKAAEEEMFPTAPSPPSEADLVKERAREIAQTVWDRKNPKPAGRGAFLGLVSVAHALIEAGHTADAVTAGMLAATPVTIKSVEFAIGQANPPERKVRVI